MGFPLNHGKANQRKCLNKSWLTMEVRIAVLQERNKTVF